MNDKNETHWIITALDPNRDGFGYRKKYQCINCKAKYMSDPSEYNDAIEFIYCPNCGRRINDDDNEIIKFRENRKVEW